jgi:hypothetical protein
VVYGAECALAVTGLIHSSQELVRKCNQTVFRCLPAREEPRANANTESHRPAALQTPDQRTGTFLSPRPGRATQEHLSTWPTLNLGSMGLWG